MNKTNILIVEDENIVALDIKNRLKKLGYVVVGRSATGEGAIDKAAEPRPDLILMDIRLKGEMDGIAAAAEIRQQLDIPVIYLTAYSDEATLQRARVTEPYGYLIKPFEDRDLHTTISMALYRHKAERELRESRQWLATTLRSIGDAVIATDRRGCIKFMNPVAERLTGWSQAEALGHPSEEIFKIINGKTRLPAANPVERVLAENRTVELDENTLLIAKDGQEIPIDDSAAPIVDETGMAEGVVLVFRDISERTEAEAQMRQFTRDLQIQNAELDAFSYTVAHDLKSPLNPIIGFADLLVEDHHTLPADQLEEYLTIIARNSRKMANVVDELLLLAHVRQAEVEVEPICMATVLAESQQRLNYMIEEYQAEIILPDIWPMVASYAPWIEEVWVNFLSNGLKYGGRPPRLELGATRQADGMVKFWVQDNGPGLTPDAQAQLFTPFTQLKQIRVAGHGLGLSIVRRIVGKLGGLVGVESEGVPGRGSRFYFTLPGEEMSVQTRSDNGRYEVTLEKSAVVAKG